ncbi:GNAT family N-acetyltransferase [Microbulbifer aggregans]|uniref:GNAT family N-acetyltransferase n=1 Tax=Microbulbifer aggregans TaxID=1769779 RepID=UPI001CFC5CC4|nr:GNAT family N-acetyltransferase [Microbulbifer aggregans]
MEAQTLAEAVEIKESKTEAERSGLNLNVAFTLDGAKKLLHTWELADQRDAPRVATAKADFFLPFLSEIPGDKTPYVALWKKDGKPDGILIGRLSVRRPLITIGNRRLPMPQLRTLNITEGGLEALSAETALQQKKYLQALLAGGDLECISIFRLSPDGEAGKALDNGLNKSGDGNPTKVARWFTELNDRHGNPVVTNSAKTRSGFRRKDRKLVEAFDGSVEIREIRNPQDIAGFLKVAVNIVAASYQQSIGVGVKDDMAWKSTSRIHAENGSFRGYLLEVEGEPIAYIVGPVVDGTFTLLATSFLPQYGKLAPGTYLLRRVIERLQNEGIRWIDYGIGDYSYKELYGTLRREDTSTNFYAASTNARIARGLNVLANSTTRFLQSSGLLKRLKQIRRSIIDRLKNTKTASR